MKTLTTKRIFVLIWVAILASLLADIYFLIQIYITTQAYKQYSVSMINFWITVVRTITTFILLIISINLWQVVKAYTHRNKWQPHFYYKLRHIGYWAIALTLISPSIQMIIFYPQFASHLKSSESKLDAILHFCLLTFANSSIMWVLTLSIFLFAELLQVANQFKAENESII